MALPVFAKFYTQLNTDNSYNIYSQAKFEPMNSEWSSELDCDPFKEQIKIQMNSTKPLNNCSLADGGWLLSIMEL